MKAHLFAVTAGIVTVALLAPADAAAPGPSRIVVDATVRIAEGYYPSADSTAPVIYRSEPCAVRLRSAVPNAYDALLAARANRCISSFDATQTPDGHYLTCVEGRCESPGFYWAVYLNGALTCVGVDEVVLTQGDEVAFSYESYATAAFLVGCEVPARPASG